MLYPKMFSALAVLVVTSGPVAAHRAATPVVVIHATDYAYTGPKTAKAGVITFRLVNDGKELHHMSMFRLAKGKTVADLVAAFKNPGPPPSWAVDVGGPNPAPAGGTAEATLDLDAATYVFACFINSPGSPVPHMAKGMMASIVIEPNAGGVQQAGLPMGDLTIHTSDYTFAMPVVASGKHVITVVNDGPQPHEVVLVKLAPGKKIADALQWADKDLMKGPPPAEIAGGMSGLAKGRSGNFPVDLKPGEYGILCFVPDMKDGKSHAVHGMLRQFTVK